MMGKTDDLKAKMNNKTTASFSPRASVAVQPLMSTEHTAPVEEKIKKNTTPKPVAKTPKQEPIDDELVALYAKVPKEDKRWLDHRKVDTGEELGELVSQAINLLRKQSSK